MIVEKRSLNESMPTSKELQQLIRDYESTDKVADRVSLLQNKFFPLLYNYEAYPQARKNVNALAVQLIMPIIKDGFGKGTFASFLCDIVPIMQNKNFSESANDSQAMFKFLYDSAKSGNIELLDKSDKAMPWFTNQSMWDRALNDFIIASNSFALISDKNKIQRAYDRTDNISVDKFFNGDRVKPTGFNDRNNFTPDKAGQVGDTDQETICKQISYWNDKYGIPESQQGSLEGWFSTHQAGSDFTSRLIYLISKYMEVGANLPKQVQINEKSYTLLGNANNYASIFWIAFPMQFIDGRADISSIADVQTPYYSGISIENMRDTMYINKNTDKGVEKVHAFKSGNIDTTSYKSYVQDIRAQQSNLWKELSSNVHIQDVKNIEQSLAIIAVACDEVLVKKLNIVIKTWPDENMQHVADYYANSIKTMRKDSKNGRRQKYSKEKIRDLLMEFINAKRKDPTVTPFDVFADRDEDLAEFLANYATVEAAKLFLY